ncbi:hypothetical protein ABID29_001526 [Streptococcus rupicaprae]|uniref:Uncharacterized protein n=1 Tax=Streptococcus rupicaprae TaxID=759619 RepID=A0ABV2FIR6_9STRE
MKRDAIFYQKLLFWYLAIYGLLHVGWMMYLHQMDSEWGLVVYILIFWIHIPLVLLASFFSFLGKRLRKSWLWGLACLCFVLSNAGWIGMVVQSGGVYYWELLFWSLTTLIPIYSSFQLTRLSK